ncbi:hypothetical protein [Pseudoalteromonas sp. MMG022]|uniref:hypothetical protein n=1 Tax=Pseudoalteromonas sp. MMG022 TaxID=2909978 RepID=UPI001F254470|nr:hypothetical protein [Pseudoalteromonas sp. MMG022]MCF6436244.1 hypothetical protein [Pseudoalteromonas sp. MMG022]
MDLKLIELVIPLGVPGVALIVFYLISKKFDIKLSKLGKKTSAAFAFVFLLFVGGVVLTTLYFWKPIETTSKNNIIERSYIKESKYTHNGEVTIIREIERNVQYDLIEVSSKNLIVGVFSVYDWLEDNYPAYQRLSQAIMLLPVDKSDKKIPMDEIVIKLKSGHEKKIYVNNDTLWANSNKNTLEHLNETLKKNYNISMSN